MNVVLGRLIEEMKIRLENSNLADMRSRPQSYVYASAKTHWESPSSSPLWKKAAYCGPPGSRFLCHSMENRRFPPASSPLPRPRGFPEDGSSQFLLAMFCPSPPDVKRAFVSTSGRTSRIRLR